MRGRDLVPVPVEGEQRNAQGQGREEDEFGDTSGDSGDTRKAKGAEYRRNDKKNECVIKHDEPCGSRGCPPRYKRSAGLYRR